MISQRNTTELAPESVTLPQQGSPAVADAPPPLRIGLLTGGDDRSYAHGLTQSLVARGIAIDFIGSNNVRSPAVEPATLVAFLNLRGDQSTDAALHVKAKRLLLYYLRLLHYAATTRTRVFHILWNNKVEWFDRTLLMMIYRLAGRRVVLTAHNVNAARRDGCDSSFNRATLRIQYRLASHVFVHTERMRRELIDDFAVPPDRTSVIPFGINDTTPKSAMTCEQARERLGLAKHDKVLLFFGQIAPYKGLEYLLDSLAQLVAEDTGWRLVVAGKVKPGCEDYGDDMRRRMQAPTVRDRITAHVRHIPDDQVEIYFKAADVLVIPYVQIFQSGVPFLAYSFGLPVIATDVGSLRDDVIEGRTGSICRPRNPHDLARAIRAHFDSELQQHPQTTRHRIREHATQRHSWATVATITEQVYRRVLRPGPDAGT